MKCNYRYLLYSLSLTLLSGTQLFWEDFSNDEIPFGWEMEPNWQVRSEGYDNHIVGDPPPAACFYWSPSLLDYERSMTTPVIDVGDESQVLVNFFFELDYFQASNATNGLRIEYLSNSDWITVLSYEINSLAGDVDLSGRYESFTADVDGDFQIRWVAYGTSSTYINSWDVDNIRVSTLPKLTYVNIESSNEDSSTAYEGTDISLKFTADAEIVPHPYVHINGTPCTIENLGGTDWVANYSVQASDPDGPLQFTIDFTDNTGVEGKRVKETTDGSTVIVDNSDPPRFMVGTVIATGGIVASEIWNSTNTEIQLDVNIPEDSAVTSFSYTIGNSLLFNGTNDEVIISGITDYQATNALTVEAWIKPNSWSDFDGILNYATDELSSKAGFGFVYFATGWRFFLQTTSNSIDYISMAEVSTPSGQWTHLAVTYDGEKVKIFRNGSAIDSTGATGDIQWSGAPPNFRLGSFIHEGSTGYFDGQIDDVRIWNIVRTGSQIKASREITIDKNEPGLVGYWQMDAGSGGTVTDSTSIANHGIINGATWVIEDSPLNFQVPVYDTGVIVGSAFQLRGRINTNDFEVFGEKDTITVNDLNAGIKTVSASSDAFEAITDFAHEETAQLSAFLFDVTGNYSLGDTSTTNTVIDIIANSPTPVSIYSDNTFPHLVKTGDVVTITMAYDEDVNTPAVTVDGNDADDVSDLGGEQFSSTYTLTGSESEGSLPFTINTIDYLGNSGTHLGSTDGSTVVYDKTLPTLSPVSIASNNADTTWAKANDSISVIFNSNEEISADYALSFDGIDDEVKITGSGFISGNESRSISVWADGSSGNIVSLGDGAGTSNQRFSILIQSNRRVLIIGQNNDWHTNYYLPQNQMTHLVVTHDGSTVKLYANGVFQDQISKTYNTDSSMPIMIGTNTDDRDSEYFNGIIDNVIITRDALSIAEVSALYNGNNVALDNLIAKFNFNEGSGSVAYDQSGNGNDGDLTNMDLTSAWFFQRGSAPTATIMSQDASISTINSNQFRADYTTTITDPEGEVQFGISFADLAGNEGEMVTSTTNNSRVIFDRTAPADFTVGTVIATGGNVVANAWNSTNTGLNINVPIASDTTLKNGTVQLWAKIGSNAFTAIGGVSTITNSDLGSDKLISLDSAEVEALSGFAEEDSIYIKAVMNDRPGNVTEGSESINQLVIDQVLPNVVNSHIESDNADSTKAKIDDNVTIIFQVDELIQSPTMIISGGSGTVTDLGSFNWSGTYTMQETDDEGVISYTVDEILDARGNPINGFTSTSNGSQVLFDRTKPELDQVQAQTNNTWNNLWALEDDSASIYVNASEDLISISCTFNGLATTDNQYGPDEYELGYTFSNTDTEGLVAFEIVFVDSAGNTGDTVRASTDNTYIVFDKTAPSGFTVGNVSAIGGNMVATFWNSTNTGLDVIVPIDSDSTLDSGRVQIWAKVGANNFEILGNSSFILSSEVGATKTMSIPGDSVRAITGYTENDTLIFNAYIFDIPGNETNGTMSTTTLLIDETPPSLISASYESNFSDSSLATVGHVVTLTFETDVEIQTPSATISTQNAIISDLGNNRWSASYEMQNGDTEGVIPFQIATLTDSRGNPTEGTSSTTDGTIVTFDNTKPTLSSVNIVSNNADSSWAKVGDTITVEFIGNELLTYQSATIVTQTATITSTGSANFYSLSFDGMDNYVQITNPANFPMNSFSVEMWLKSSNTDKAGTPFSYASSQSDNDLLLYDIRNLQIYLGGQSVDTGIAFNSGYFHHLAVTWNSSNGHIYLYKDGNLLWSTPGFAQGISLQSGGSLIFAQEQDNVGGGFDQTQAFDGIIDEVRVWNTARSQSEIESTMNTELNGDESGLVAYWNFNEGTGSSVLDLSVNNNNGNNNGAIWDTDIPFNKEYYAKYVMTETDPEGAVPFEIVVTDSVGLVSDPVTQTNDGTVVIFDRTAPTLSTVHIESDNANNTLIAIGGDNVYLTFTPQEPLILDSVVATIAGIATNLTESNGSYTATIILTGGEPDGILEFTIDFKDRAGNSGVQITETTDGSYVNHDVYPPEIEIASITSNNPDTSWAKAGDSVFVTFTASEALDSISIIIAGVASSYNQLSMAKYQGYHIMDESNEEGDIPFLITYTDLGGAIGPDADTTTNNTNVQFDKTVPEISLTRMTTNNIYGDSLAGIGSVDTLLFTISEVQNELSVELAESVKTPFQDGLSFSATHTFTASDTEGWVDFSISVTDSAGNPSDTLITTQDGSQVRFDGTLPILPIVDIFSNNSNDSSLCVPGDSLFLQYTTSETLRSSTITLAGNSPAESGWLNGFNYAVYVMTGTEDEGFIPFTIGFEDWVGNPGDTISETTNGSSVLFDMTPPDDFFLGNVVSKNGIEVPGYWNASNEILEIVIPIPNDETLVGGGIQFQTSFGVSYSNLADTVNIDQSDLGMSKIVSISETDFENISEFNENMNVTFQAVLWDKAGNITIGTASASTIHIDQTLPILNVVTHSTNNAIADSLAKVGDTDTLTVSSIEGLDTIQVQIFSQAAVHSGSNKDWSFTYTFQETDNDGMVSFNIVFGDTAGNLGTNVSATTDGSTVRFDGTKPTLTSVSFSSTNSMDGGLAILADTLYLDFVSNEDLLTNEVLIAGFNADTTFKNESRTPFRSWRIMDGTEAEGYIEFEIGYSDLVGNIGDIVNETTNETSILFDITPPDDFELDTVFVSGGKVIFGFWNASNDTLTLRVPIPEDDETLIGGTFQSQVRFGEGTYVNLGDEKTIIGGQGVSAQDLIITRMEFTTLDGFSENLNVQFITKAKDRAGNETVGSVYNTTFHIDEIVPSLTEVLIQSNNELDSTWAKISNVVSLDFTASEGLSSVTSVLFSDSLTGISENVGSSWTVTKTILPDNAEGIIPFYITYNDSAGNEGDQVSSTTDGRYVILDKTNPTITSLLEGNEGLDIDYYNQADSITLYWSQFDSLAGVKDAYVGLGSDSNLTDVLDWTLSNQGSLAGLGGLSLSNDGIYFGAVFVRDSAGNHSDTLWGNSIYIDTQNPDTGSIIDAYWVMDLDYVIDSTRLSYIWSNFTDNTEIDYYEIAIGTEDDTSNVMNWIRSDSTDSMTIAGLNLVRDTLYYSYIRAFDMATNKSLVARTDGVYFDDSFPVVNKITPNVISDSAGFLSVLYNDTITIKFNRPIYVYGLSVNSNVDSNLTISHEYGDSIITVIWTDTLASYDTLTVIVDSAVAYNTLWLTDTLHFYSKLWADLNNDYDITIEDILTFNQTWPETDLGPFKDDPPHVRPEPDGEANLTDLAAFGKMWHWKYFNLEFDTTLIAARSTDRLKIIAQGSKANFTIPKNVAMAEILIGESNLDIKKMHFVNPSGSAFMFTSSDTTHGLIQFSMADHRGFDSTLTLIIPETEQEYFQAQIQYKFMDITGVTLDDGIASIDVEILPDKFMVYNNYPNPFNPITTINYDLPEERDVKIIIYDLLGKTIRHLELNKVKAGRHKFVWHGTNNFGKRVSTGIYFLQITAEQDIQTQKMLLLK